MSVSIINDPSLNTGQVSLEDVFQKKKRIRIRGEKYTFTVDRTEYKWDGGFGSIISSYERGVKRGDTRMIGNVLFYVYMCEDTSFFTRKKRVCWSIPDISIEEIRELKKEIFEVE